MDHLISPNAQIRRIKRQNETLHLCIVSQFWVCLFLMKKLSWIRVSHAETQAYGILILTQTEIEKKL